MTGPRIDFDREAAKRAGYTDAEIDEFLYKPRTPRAASESTTAVRDKAPARDDAAYLGGLARQAGQGATFGFADEAEAGLRSMVGSRTYRDVRDEVRAGNEAFARENPKAALAANVAGGLATGGGMVKAATAVPKVGAALRATGMLPKMEATATTWGKIGAGAKAGAVAGAIGGAGVAQEKEDILTSAAKGGVAGGVAGGALTAGLLSLQGARNAVGAVTRNKPGMTTGRFGRAVEAETPEQSGAARVLRTVGRSGKTLDQLEAASAAADGPDIVGEVIGPRGVRQVRTARGIGDQSPEMIEAALTDRARGEVGRVRGAVTREIGDAVDDQAYIAGKKIEAQTNAGPLYEQAVEGRSVTDPRVLDLLNRPGARDAYDDAVKLAANDGRTMPSAAQVLKGARLAPAGDDVAAGAASKVDGMDDEALRAMSQDELRGVRRSVGSLSKLSDKELEAEHMYLLQQQGADQAKASIRDSQDYAEYLSLQNIGLKEDARGAAQSMGYTDPAEFAQVARDAALGAKNAAERAPKIAAVEKELARREAAFGAIPSDASTAPAKAVPSRTAVTLPDEQSAPKIPTLDARQIQYWKFGLDAKIGRLEGMPGGAASKEYAQLIQQRNAVEDLLFEHTEGWGKAQQAYAKPMQEADAFSDGIKRGRTMQPADADAMLAGPNAAQRSKGVGNTILDDLSQLGDGAAGPIRNPAPTVMGSDKARARLKVATGGDAEKQARIVQAASNAARRLQTKNAVMGGSQTFEKFADAGAEGIDAGTIARGLMQPKSAIAQWIGKGAASLGKTAMGQSMDEAAKVLMAGAPGQMTRAEAIAMLKRMEPAMIAQLERQMLNRGVAGSVAGRSGIVQGR